MTYTHTCPCGAEYQDDDPDVYFCEACIAERKRIAAEIDAKTPKHSEEERQMSDLQRYDQAAKVRGFVNAANFL